MDFEENRPAQDVPLEENIEQTQDERTAQETQQNEAARREKQYETFTIAVYVEKGSKGGNLSNVCIPILDAYFSSATHYETVMTENTAD